MKPLRKISEEEANKAVDHERWSDEVVWAEYGDFTPMLEELNEQLEEHELELVEIDAHMSDMPILLRKIS